jgi:hypothetical protein
MTSFFATAAVSISTFLAADLDDDRRWIVRPPELLAERIAPSGELVLEGRLVDVRGFDAEHSVLVAIIEDSAGRRRSVVARWLDDASRALVAAFPDPSPEREARRAAEPAIPERFDMYAKDDPKVERERTPNFVFHWGRRTDGSGAAWFTPGFRERNVAYFESVRDFYRDVLKAPLPGRTAKVDHRTNVYITGTGLEHHEEGFAFAALDIIMHPAALAPGSSVVPHEFAHCVQLASGGFRNSEFVGWFWENHAEWCTHQYFPGIAPSFWAWLERRHYEINSSRMNYGSWMWLQVLSEDPRFGPAFVFDLWTKNRLDEHDRSIEDPIQTALRLMAERPDIGSEAAAIEVLGGIFGSVAERSAFWSGLEHGFAYAESEAVYETHSAGALRHRTHLVRWPGGDGVFLPRYSAAPRDFGVNIVDLDPAPGASTIDLVLHGIRDVATHAARASADGGAWRASLLVERSDGTVDVVRSIATLDEPARLSIATKPGDRRVRLAVAATPSTWTPIEFRPGYNAKRRFPWAVALDGATPRSAIDRATHSGATTTDGLVRHANGGGFVAPSARVAESAWIGPNAMVLGEAKVEADAVVVDHAVVRDRAVVAGSAVVRGTATVRDEARIGGNALVGDGAVVAGRVQVGERARVLEFIHLHGDGSFAGDALAKGFGEIHTNDRHAISGFATFGEDCEVHLPDDLDPLVVDRGRIYGFMAQDQWRNDWPRDVERGGTTTVSARWLPLDPSAAGPVGDRGRRAPVAFVPDRAGDHPLFLASNAVVTADGGLDLREGAAFADGLPIASAAWTIDLVLDPSGDLRDVLAVRLLRRAGDEGGPETSIRLRVAKDADGVRTRLLVEPEDVEAHAALDGRIDVADARSVRLTLSCREDGDLVLSGEDGEVARLSLPGGWAGAHPTSLRFGGATFESITALRTAAAD